MQWNDRALSKFREAVQHVPVIGLDLYSQMWVGALKVKRPTDPPAGTGSISASFR